MSDIDVLGLTAIKRTREEVLEHLPGDHPDKKKILEILDKNDSNAAAFANSYMSWKTTEAFRGYVDYPSDGVSERDKESWCDANKQNVVFMPNGES